MAGHRERLTPQRIRNYRCEPGKSQSFFWDEIVPALAVRVTAAGAKSFVFESKLEGKTIRTTVGSVAAWPLESVWSGSGHARVEVQRGAREEAGRLQSLIDGGQDPRIDRAERLEATKAKQEAARRSEAPASEAWGAYVKARTPKWSARSLKDHQRFTAPGGKPKTRGRKSGEGDRTEPGALVGLLARPLREIDRDTVAAWVECEAGARPTNAALGFRLLRAFVNWCAEQPEYRDQVQRDACSGRAVRDALPARKTKRDALQREQLKPWFAAVRAIPNPVIAAYLQVVLLTGARREEVAHLRWGDVDFQWDSMVIRDKVEGDRTIPLTPYVKSLLLELKGLNEAPSKVVPLRPGRKPAKPRRPSEWVFWSGSARSGRLQEPRIQHVKALESAGIPHVSIHGLRRSFGTLAEWVETPTGICAQIMGHKPSATAERHYKARPIDLLRLWHAKIEGWILEQAGIEQPAQSPAAKLAAVEGGKK